MDDLTSGPNAGPKVLSEKEAFIARQAQRTEIWDISCDRNEEKGTQKLTARRILLITRILLVYLDGPIEPRI